MQSKSKLSPKRIKVTITAEGYHEDLDEALEQGLKLAKARVMGMSFSSKKKNGPTWGVQTTRSRGPVRLRI